MAAISSAADGTWIAAAATTWVGGVAPTENDRATILNTHDVEIDGTIICGDDTATAAITIDAGGSLTLPSTVAADYTLTCKGDFKVAGTFNIGTVANIIPKARKFNLKLNYSAALADGKYGLIIQAGGTFVCQGENPWTSGLTDPDRCLLNANAAANDTAITADGSTGWNANDRIAIAPTSRTYTERDPESTNAGQVNSVAGTTINLKNFGGTGGGLKYAHSGTSPTQAEVINLTRNIVIENYDGGPGAPGNVGYVVFETSATVDVDWTEFRYLGYNAADKYGITIKTTSGSANLNRCSFHDFQDWTIYASGATHNNWTIANSVCFGGGASYYPIRIDTTSGTSWTINNVWYIYSTGVGFYCLSVTGTFTNNRSTGHLYRGFDLVQNLLIPGTISGLVSHSNNDAGFNLTYAWGTISQLTSWRNNKGIYISGITGGKPIINTMTLFGNSTNNIELASTMPEIDLIDITSNGDSSFSTTNGISVGFSVVRMYSCDFSTVGGIKTAHTTDILVQSATLPRIYLYNTKLGATTKVDLSAAYKASSIVFAMASKYQTTAGLAGETGWFYGGTITADTSYYHTASPSAKLTPSSATYKLESRSLFIPVINTNNPTVSVWFRKSAAYNGAQPRLVVRRNDALGFTSDTVIATSSAAVDVDTPPGTFTELTAATGAVGADGVLEVFVDCSGTAGYINLCDWTVTGAQAQTANLDAFWSYGQPFPGLLTAAVGGGGGGNSVIGSGIIINGR